MWLNIGQTAGISELTKMAAATYLNVKANLLRWSPMHHYYWNDKAIPNSGNFNSQVHILGLLFNNFLSKP